ncbi:MAG: hypothetical protein RLZZ437_721 [Pseudomonadota bacterium]|jgi:hypothetical protein
MTLTALKKYQRLECAGLWQDMPDAQRRDVIVSIGETSLILRDPRNEQVVAHWSLPAVARENGHALPALYKPGKDTAETLELSDPDMIAALDTVHKAIVAALPQPGRLRGAIMLFLGILVGGGLVAWLPDALRQHTASVVPASVRAEIGQMAYDDIVRLTGAPCTEPQAQAALAALSGRIAGEAAAPILLVLRQGLGTPGQLPGDIVLLPPALIAQEDGPRALATAISAEIAQAKLADPLLPILTHAGLRASFTLLTTGALPPGALEGYGEAFLKSPAPSPANPTPSPDAPLPDPLMSDADWIALQAICDL